MIDSRDLLIAIASLVICLYLLVNYDKLSGLPNLKILTASFLLLTASSSSSLLVGVFSEDALVFAQHALAPLAGVLLSVWSWLTFMSRRGTAS